MQFSDHVACTLLLEGFAQSPVVLSKDKSTRAAQPFAAQTSIKAFFGGEALVRKKPGKGQRAGQSQNDAAYSEPIEASRADTQPPAPVNGVQATVGPDKESVARDEVTPVSHGAQWASDNCSQAAGSLPPSPASVPTTTSDNSHPATVTKAEESSSQKRSAAKPTQGLAEGGKRRKTEAKPKPAKALSIQSLVDNMFARSKSKQ